MRTTLALWVAFLVLIVLFAASLLAARQAGGGWQFHQVRTFAVADSDRLIVFTGDLKVEGCVAPLPSGEQEVRLQLHNLGQNALRDVRITVALDGKPPKAPAAPLSVRRIPRKASLDLVLLFDKTAQRELSIDVEYRFGLLGLGGSATSASKLLPPCQSAPSQ